MTFQLLFTGDDNDQWGENEWGAEDDGMGFGTDINMGENAEEEGVEPELEGMGSDVEEVEEEEREL